MKLATKQDFYPVNLSQITYLFYYFQMFKYLTLTVFLILASSIKLTHLGSWDQYASAIVSGGVASRGYVFDKSGNKLGSLDSDRLRGGEIEDLLDELKNHNRGSLSLFGKTYFIPNQNFHENILRLVNDFPANKGAVVAETKTSILVGLWDQTNYNDQTVAQSEDPLVDRMKKLQAHLVSAGY